VGTALPFFIMAGPGIGYCRWAGLFGVKSSRASLLLVMSIAVAVTSIPVISRIFFRSQNSAHTFCSAGAGRGRCSKTSFSGPCSPSATAIADSSGPSGPQDCCAHWHHRWLTSFLVWSCFPRATKTHFEIQIQSSRHQFSGDVHAVDRIRLCRCGRGYWTLTWSSQLFLPAFAVSRKRLGDALTTISGFSFALFIPVYFRARGLQPDL